MKACDGSVRCYDARRPKPEIFYTAMIYVEKKAQKVYILSMGLKEYFEENNKVAIAFSGGVDSSYLLAEALRLGADVRAYYARSAFQPEFEREDARRLADALGAELCEIELDVLSDETVTSNPEDRCYHCKRLIMGAITRAAASDGYDIVCDGTNASDDVSDRPGFRALREMGIRSPLRECGITKAEIRERARELGLDVWDKPAYACLATRIPAGEKITADKLRITEEAETRMFGLGFTDFRVRMRDDGALVQISEAQHEEAMRRSDEIISAIGDLYSSVTIDSEPRRKTYES